MNVYSNKIKSQTESGNDRRKCALLPKVELSFIAVYSLVKVLTHNNNIKDPNCHIVHLCVTGGCVDTFTNGLNFALLSEQTENAH